MTFPRKHVFPLVFLIIGVSLIYSNSLDGSFQFDDQQITDRPNLHLTKLSLDSLKGTLYWTPNQKRIYRPLPCLTLGLNYYFGKSNPFAYHIVNVIIHILCAITVYVFLHTLLSIPGVRPAFAAKHRYEITVIATFLFAFHPIQTNVASYIIQRMTSMAALFYLISVTGYISFRKQTLSSGEGSEFRKYFSLSVCIVGGALSFLSKQNTAILPLTLLILDYLFFYNNATPFEKKRFRRIYAASILILLTLLCYKGPEYFFSFLEGYEHRDFSLIERLITQPRVIFFYLYLLLIPGINHLNLNHDVFISNSLFNPPQTFFAISGILVLITCAVLLRKRHNLLSFAILWYLGNLVIESTIIPLELIFEHRTYLPGVLVFCFLSLGIVYLSERLLQRRNAIIFTSLLLILYGNGTYLRNFTFKTPVSMWLDVVEKSPNLARAHANLGKTYIDLGYNVEGRKSLERAVEMRPYMPEALINLGKLYIKRLGMIDEGIELIKRAQRLNPKYILAFMALGDAYFIVKDYEKAERYYGIVLRKLNFFLPAMNNLGVVKICLGKNDEAVRLFQNGIRLDPTYEDFYLNLAKLHSNENRFDDAIKTLEHLRAMKGSSKRGKGLLEIIVRKANAATPVEG